MNYLEEERVTDDHVKAKLKQYGYTGGKTETSAKRGTFTNYYHKSGTVQHSTAGKRPVWRRSDAGGHSTTFTSKKKFAEYLDSIHNKKNEGVKMSKVNRILEKYLGEDVPPIQTEIPVIQKRETNVAVDRAGDGVLKTPESGPSQTHQAVTNASHDYLMKIQELVHGNNSPENIVAAIKQNLEKFNKERVNKNADMPKFHKA